MVLRLQRGNDVSFAANRVLTGTFELSRIQRLDHNSPCTPSAEAAFL